MDRRLGHRIRTVFWAALMPVARVFYWFGFVLFRLVQTRLSRARFELRPDDIFIATYPKSGTTLMQMMVYQLRGDGRMDFSHINNVCPFFELELQQNEGRSLQNLESPRCFKTHLTADAFPMETGRYIYVLRDVRDVIVSAFHHARLVDGVDQSLEQFAEDVLSAGNSSQQVIPGADTSWFRHLESWWPHRSRPNVLFLSYEEMVADLEGTIRKVADFCGFAVREEEMPRILERCGIEFMKQHEDKFDPRFQMALRGDQGFIREGKSGSGRALSARHRQIVDQKLSTLARRLGCPTGEPYQGIIESLDRA